MMDEEMENWVAGLGTAAYLNSWTRYHIEMAWLEATRRADRKARYECERIALQYSQAYGQIDDAMAIARDIRATIKEE